MSNVLLNKIGHTAVLALNKKETMNALCKSFIEDINKALDQIESDDDIYTVIITGTDKAFIAGADISEMINLTPDEMLEWSGLGSNLNLRLEKMQLPVIAAINGYALGGGLELAMACDIRLAAETANMGLPETKLGVICGAGGTQRLPAIVGEGISKELIFTGRTIDAEEALRIGLVNKVVSGDSLMDEAMELALSIEKNGQLAVRAAKKAINYGLGKGAAEDCPSALSIEDGCFFERKTFAPLFDTEDQKIGMSGFLRKEKDIDFKNR